MTMPYNRTRGCLGTAAALLMLAAGTACGRDAADDGVSLPYDADLIYSSTSRCAEVEPAIAPEFFVPDDEATITEDFDYGVLDCSWRQSTPASARSITISVGMIDETNWEEHAQEWADAVTTDDFIPVDGLGDIALLGPTNADTDQYESYGLVLYVFEGNAVFEASAESIADTGDLLFRASTLASAEASLVAMAETFLQSVGAEQHAALGATAETKRRLLCRNSVLIRGSIHGRLRKTTTMSGDRIWSRCGSATSATARTSSGCRRRRSPRRVRAERRQESSPRGGSRRGTASSPPSSR
jgi:hypothetical protein